MDIMKGKWRKNLLHKAWDRCRCLSFGRNKSSRNTRPSLTRSKSWSSTTTSPTNLMDTDHKETKKKRDVAPHGCFYVFVGPQKQRFVLKAKSANHPLFKMLLEDAEMEFGFASQGPIRLPCDVDMFYKVLAEMDHSCRDDGDDDPPSWSPLFMCTPSRKSTSSLGNCKGYGAYRLLSPARSMIKLNNV